MAQPLFALLFLILGFVTFGLAVVPYDMPRWFVASALILSAGCIAMGNAINFGLI